MLPSWTYCLQPWQSQPHPTTFACKAAIPELYPGANKLCPVQRACRSPSPAPSLPPPGAPKLTRARSVPPPLAPKATRRICLPPPHTLSIYGHRQPTGVRQPRRLVLRNRARRQIRHSRVPQAQLRRSLYRHSSIPYRHTQFRCAGCSPDPRSVRSHRKIYNILRTWRRTFVCTGSTYVTVADRVRDQNRRS